MKFRFKAFSIVMIGVDVVLGPMLTFIFANTKKPRRELARDLGVFVVFQLCALTYGSLSLWNCRLLELGAIARPSSRRRSTAGSHIG